MASNFNGTENYAPERQIQKNSFSQATSRRILFVDDDDDDRFLFDRVMKQINNQFNLHFAATGDEMFTILDSIVPDLIFLDVHMPGKSGITCLKKLRYLSKYDSVPIIIYSVTDKKSLIEDCYMAKANYYIIKPMTEQKISLVMNKILEINWDAERYPLYENFLL